MKKKYTYLSIFFLFIHGFLFSTNTVKEHPFYVSIFDINYDKKAHQLQIIVKAFTSDVEKSININFNAKDTTQNSVKVAEYFTKHFQIWNAKQFLQAKMFKLLHRKETVYMYFYISDVKFIKNIHIKSDFLYKYFKEQSNIFHFYIDNALIKSKKLTNPEKSFTFVLQQPS